MVGGRFRCPLCSRCRRLCWRQQRTCPPSDRRSAPANAAAAANTTKLLTAAEDEVSAAIAGVFRRVRPGLSGAQCTGGGRSRPLRTGP
nr:PE family protein [Mycobacterium gordonae]